MENNNWIQGAVKKPGSFTSYCKRAGYTGVTESCIAKALKSKNATTRRRANLAKVFRKMHDK